MLVRNHNWFLNHLLLFILQLSSIPELNTPTATTQPDAIDIKLKTEDTQDSSSKEEPQQSAETSTVTETVVETIQDRPEYDRFVRMVQVGVPLPAVKLKVSLEGLDPNILDEILGK